MLISRSIFLFVLAGFFAVEVLADAAAPASPTSYGMTSGRAVASGAALVSLLGVIVGGIAAARPTGGIKATVALLSGLIGAGVGAYVIATTSGIGTGGGRAGAFVGLALGIVAVALAGVAVARARRSD